MFNNNGQTLLIYISQRKIMLPYKVDRYFYHCIHLIVFNAYSIPQPRKIKGTKNSAARASSSLS